MDVEILWREVFYKINTQLWYLLTTVKMINKSKLNNGCGTNQLHEAESFLRM
jgi:hypothetical protein